jgi:hypothetical protein
MSNSEAIGALGIMKARLEHAINVSYPQSLKIHREHKTGKSPREIFLFCIMEIVAEQSKEAYLRGIAMAEKKAKVEGK